MRTVTYDEKTHAIVPIEPTREQIKNACDAWIDSTSRMLLNKACAAIKAAPPYQSAQVLNMVRMPPEWKKSVSLMWQCVRKHDSSIPDYDLDLMRDILLKLAAPKGEE